MLMIRKLKDSEERMAGIVDGHLTYPHLPSGVPLAIRGQKAKNYILQVS